MRRQQLPKMETIHPNEMNKGKTKKCISSQTNCIQIHLEMSGLSKWATLAACSTGGCEACAELTSNGSRRADESLSDEAWRHSCTTAAITKLHTLTPIDPPSGGVITQYLPLTARALLAAHQLGGGTLAKSLTQTSWSLHKH